MFPPELAPKSFQRFFVGLTLKDGDDSALKGITSMDIGILITFRFKELYNTD